VSKWFLITAIPNEPEKKNSPEEHFQGISIIATRSKDFLFENPEDYFQKAKYTNGETVKGKWMLALLTSAEREVLKKARANSDVYSFDDIAEVAVGIVTGANKFFLVSDDIVKEYSLQKWAYPMFGKSEHVPVVIFDDDAIIRNREIGLPTNFIWFSDEKINDLPDSVKHYISLGEKQNLHKRYKCRIREPWYSVPSVYATSLGMLKRSHDFPRLVFNKAQAYTTDTTYRVRHKKFNEATIVGSFINSLTALSAEVEGRHYGGGVLELVPSEIRKLLVPIQRFDQKELYKLNSLVKNRVTSEALLVQQDEKVLSPLGFDKKETTMLLEAWSRLRLRRQRLDAEEITEDE
jgi:adenine-specific DNA methylase